MGIPTFLSDVRSTNYSLAVICLIILGIYFLFQSNILWGIFLIVLGFLGLFSVKFFFKINRRYSEYVEKTYKKNENFKIILGCVIGAVAGIIYTSINGISTENYTGGFYFILIPLVVGGLIGLLIQKYFNKN